MAITNYVNSANIFVFPCANRKAGFWESKLATEYSLRTLIPWRITKPSFVIADDNHTTASALQNNDLEFVVNGYYFKVTNWWNAINYSTGAALWVHIRLKTKDLTSVSGTEATTILVNYDENNQTLDDANDKFKGIKFDNQEGTDSAYYYHLNIFDAAGNVLHRNTFDIACKDPIKQDDETGELSLNYGNGLTVDTNNKLIVNLNSTGGLEFTGTEGQKTIQIKLPNNSGLEHDSTGLKITNVISDITAPSNILQKITIGSTQYTIPTYTGNNGINITDDKISVSLYTSNSDNTAYSGLEFLNNKLKVKTNTGLVLSTNGLGLQYPIPDISNQGGKFLSISGTDLTWATPTGGTVIFNASTSYPVLKLGDGLSITTTNNTSYLQMQYPLPDITNNKQKILAVTSTGDGLEWVTPPSGGNGTIIYTNSSATASYPSLKIGSGLSVDSNNILSASGGGGTYSAGSGISINSNNAISVSLATNSGLEFSSSKLRLKKSNGINIDSDGVFIKLSTPTEDTTNKGGLWVDTNGLGVNRYGKYCGITTAGSVSSYALYLGTNSTTLMFTGDGSNNNNAYVEAIAYPYGTLIFLYITKIEGLPSLNDLVYCTTKNLFVPSTGSNTIIKSYCGSNVTLGVTTRTISGSDCLAVQFSDGFAPSINDAYYYRPIIFPCTPTSIKL